MTDTAHQAANYSLLASSYSFWEYILLGRQLQRCRQTNIGEFASASKVLLLGDGNGRFSTHLLAQFPAIKITSIDASSSMLKQAKKRRENARTKEDRIHNIQQNILECSVNHASFDVVVAQFFFDGFEQAQLELIAEKISRSLKPNGRLLVSEFHIPTDTRMGNWRARITLRLLYSIFGLLTGLKTRRLADYQTVLSHSGFKMEKSVFLSQKTLVSQIFRKQALSTNGIYRSDIAH